MSVRLIELLNRGASFSNFIAPALPGTWASAARIASGLLAYGASLVETGVDPLTHVARIQSQQAAVLAALDQAEAAIAAQHQKHGG